MPDVTLILQAMESGDPHAAQQLLPAVYDELRHLAARRLSSEKPGQTIQATELVHEAYIKIVGNRRDPWHGRSHFFAAAAEAMRRILIDNARRKNAIRHGGGLVKVEMDDATLAIETPTNCDDVLALDEALTRLAEEDPAKADLVKLRYFAGLTIEEAAAALDISRATASRYWEYSKAWLLHELQNRATRQSR